MLKKSLVIILITSTSLSFGQGMFGMFSRDEPQKEWQIGIGADVIKFGEQYADIAGDQYTIQIPRINVTKEITEELEFDGSFSIGGLDSAFTIENNLSYFSCDLSARYKPLKDLVMIDPYVFIGPGVTNIRESWSGTVNVGAGMTIWINDIVGLNGQVLYKTSFDKQNIPSHAQLCGSIIFGLGNEKRVNISRCPMDR